jgi:hypothetical protein
MELQNKTRSMIKITEIDLHLVVSVILILLNGCDWKNNITINLNERLFENILDGKLIEPSIRIFKNIVRNVIKFKTLNYFLKILFARLLNLVVEFLIVISISLFIVISCYRNVILLFFKCTYKLYTLNAVKTEHHVGKPFLFGKI